MALPQGDVFNCFLLGQCHNFCAVNRLISDHIAVQHNFSSEILPTDWAYCTAQRSKSPPIIRVLIMYSTAAPSPRSPLHRHFETKSIPSGRCHDGEMR